MSAVKKGMYIEQKNNRSVFLMADGQFVYGDPATPLSIGEEGFFYPVEMQRRWNWMPILAPALPIIAMLLLFLSTLLPSENAFAYVQLEMDAGIELGVNAAHRVISIRELDKDGKELIEQLGPWKGEGMDTLIERSIILSIGELPEKVIITTVAERADTSDSQLDQMIFKASTKAVNNDIEVRLKKATFAQRESSIEENIPVGQKVEGFITLLKEDKSKVDPDDQIKTKNHIKALNVGKDASPLPNQVEDTKEASKSNATEGQGTVEDEKPEGKSGESEASEASTKGEKVHSSVKVSNMRPVEKKPETIPPVMEKSKTVVKVRSEKPIGMKNEEKNGKDQLQSTSEKEQLIKSTTDKDQVKHIQATASSKPKKPAFAQVRHGQVNPREKIVKTQKNDIGAEKEEQK